MARLNNPNKRQQRDMLDRRWSAWMRSLGYCEHCGTRDGLTNSHIIGRSYLKTRWDPRNNQCLCFSCHGSFESQPVLFSRWIESTDCGQHVDTMIVQANSIAKPDYELWFNLYDRLKTMTPIDARDYLGDTILLSGLDLLRLENPQSTQQQKKQ